VPSALTSQELVIDVRSGIVELSSVRVLYVAS